MSRTHVLGIAAAVALTVAGCGAAGTTRTVTTTAVLHYVTTTATMTRVVRRTRTRRVSSLPPVTTTRTVTVRAPTPTTHLYPATYESGFTIQCVDAGGSYSICTCALRHIEQAVPYTTAIAATHAITTGRPPGWYTNAITACGA